VQRGPSKLYAVDFLIFCHAHDESYLSYTHIIKTKNLKLTNILKNYLYTNYKLTGSIILSSQIIKESLYWK
jgi:hypothetical protein